MILAILVPRAEPVVSRPCDLISYPENRERSGYEITRDQETKGSGEENGFWLLRRRRRVRRRVSQSLRGHSQTRKHWGREWTNSVQRGNSFANRLLAQNEYEYGKLKI